MRPLLAINLTAFALCAPPPTTATETQIAIPRIEQMPNLPEPYHMRDWQQVAHDFDTLAFDFERQGEHLPIISWATGGGVVDRPKVFAIPTFIGWNHEGYEAITCLGAVNAATVAGIDKSDQDGMDWVALCANYFNDHPGIQLYLNNDNSDTGGSFWYEIFPNILFYRIVSAYPDTPKMAEQFIAVAEQWYAASVAMGGSAVPWALPNYDITAYNFTTGELVNNGLWTEGGSAAGIAWLQYMAYTQTQNEKYLNAAKWGMEYLDQATKNPYYEILFPHSTYLAARMNAELGTHYDVTKLINWSLEGNNRRKWGDSVGKWGTMDFSAVTCSLDGNDAGSYGFAMNTFNKANSLVPMVRYDKRYARAIGKWTLNAANSLRLFYANGLPADQQTDFAWADKYDPHSTLAYEGMRPVQTHIGRLCADYKTVHGTITEGSYLQSIFTDKQYQRFETIEVDGQQRLEHIWKVDLEGATSHTITMMAEVSEGAEFAISRATDPNGPYQPFIRYNSATPAVQYKQLLTDSNELYLKLENISVDNTAVARFAIDDLWILSKSDRSPYATGDAKESGWAETNFGLYSSAFTGLLGGIVQTTNVEKILQLDCLATDYFGAPAYPTYLYYNPHDSAKIVEIDVGELPTDLYDACSNTFLQRAATGNTHFELPADHARLIVLVPSGAILRTNPRGHTEAKGIVINYK
jgi:hypothetical protein